MTTTTRERPILFATPLIPRLLDGSKSMTRRIIKFPHPGCWERGKLPESWLDQADPIGTYPTYLRSPYGVPGDRLWVRESWAEWIDDDPEPEMRGDGYILYRADNSARLICRYNGQSHAFDDAEYNPLDDDYVPPKWSPSIHMPRWASRIDLEITEVRVERLGDISEDDARAEGFARREHFIELWEQLHNKDGERFADDPWVRVISFKRIKP